MRLASHGSCGAPEAARDRGGLVAARHVARVLQRGRKLLGRPRGPCAHASPRRFARCLPAALPVPAQRCMVPHLCPAASFSGAGSCVMPTLWGPHLPLRQPLPLAAGRCESQPAPCRLVDESPKRAESEPRSLPCPRPLSRACGLHVQATYCGLAAHGTGCAELSCLL